MPDAHPSPAIETAGLTRYFNSFCALDRLDLRVTEARVFGLLGPNVAGKSTAIKIMTTLLPPSGGSARVAGFDVVTQAIEVRRRIGYVPQMLSADGSLTARENLALSASLYGLRGGLQATRIQEALDFAGVSPMADKLVKTYSGGMVRRLEIAQATLHRPRVLFLDEPTIGLDPVARMAVWERLLELRASTGVTVVLTTHDMEEADHLCDELAILHQGRLAVTGAPEQLKRDVGPHASLSDVYAHYSGAVLEQGGHIRQIRETRRTAQRLG